ncbi:MAG: DNA-binding response regulator [Spirochaetae bacterium HGW-Spirochaetae-1]|jgi:DNA-binding NarL/FixJ family response regulator|nr:MAG: DNA-binding response regulator [Spirochaetae bacterium HGW-Spirochaetae-1]
MKKKKIFLADDHSILRDGLKLILNAEEDFEIVGESGDGREALEMIEKKKPDIVVLDISMPAMSGIEIARHLRRFVPGTKILILSRHDKEEYVKQLLQYGVHGYILKDDASDELIKAIREIFKGNIYLSPRIASNLITEFIMTGVPPRSEKTGDTSSFDILSPREREILKLIAEGGNSREIGTVLRISPQTVKTHRVNIMKKLNIHKVNDLVAYAIKNGFVEV